MKKSLLMGLMALSTSLSGYALDVNEYVYTPQGRFQITGENICTNGTCSANFDGWTVMSATATTPDEVFQYDYDKQSFYTKTNVATEGMYYKFNIPNASGNYVVSFKLRQETAAWPYSTNIVAATTENVNTYGIQLADHNFINLFGNTGGFTSATDYVSYGKEIMLTPDWNTVSFTIVGDGTPRDYYLAFAGLNTTLEIADVQIQEAVQYADLRQRDEALAYAKAIVNAKEWEASDELDALKDMVEALENNITDESSQAELDDLLAGLTGEDGALSSASGIGFLDKCVDNYIATCSVGTDWAQRTGNDKIQKQNGVGDWIFYGGGKGRGFNQDGGDLLGTESREWFELGHFMYGTTPAEASMAMKKTLQPGVYIYSMYGSGATRYNKSYNGGWNYNLGFAPFDFELYVKDVAADAVKASNVVAMPTNAYRQNFIVFTVETAGEYEIGAKAYPRESTYTGSLGTLGYGYFFKTPRIYCKLDGTLSAEQIQYINDVKGQIAAVKTALENADSLSQLTYYPWLKKEIADTIAKYKKYNDFYQTLTDDDILNGFVDPVVKKENSGYANYIDGEHPETGAPIPTYNAIDTIMVNAVKPLLRTNEAYIAANKVFTDLQAVIDDAKYVKALPIYSVATGMDDLSNAIINAENAYKQYAQNGSYTVGAEENPDYNAMVEQKNILNAAVEEFKTTIPADKINTIIDIDFSGEAVLDEATNKYSIAGLKGSMEIDNYSTTTDGNTSFTKGFDVNGENPTVEVLRVGNGDGVVEVDPAAYAGKIVRISFDYYFGALTKRNNGFYLKNASAENVAGLYFCSYNSTETTPVNTFGFDFSKFSAIGSSSASNVAIYDEAKNKTSFELVLCYPTNTMFATSTNSAKGSQVTKSVSLSGDFTQFIVTSNYNIEARRSWFDNLKIETIEYDPTAVTGVQEVPEAADEAIYNIAGQKVSAPVKGQIYVKKGAAFVK